MQTIHRVGLAFFSKPKLQLVLNILVSSRFTVLDNMLMGACFTLCGSSKEKVCKMQSNDSTRRIHLVESGARTRQNSAPSCTDSSTCAMPSSMPMIGAFCTET